MRQKLKLVIKKITITMKKKFYGKDAIKIVPPPEEEKKIPVTEVSAIGYSLK